MRQVLRALTRLALCAGALLISCGALTPSTSAGDSAEQLRTLEGRLDGALAALRANDVEKAKREWIEFNEGWERIEGGVKAKSPTSYRTIEDAMGDVKTTLARPDRPETAQATSAVRRLRDVIETELPKLR